MATKKIKVEFTPLQAAAVLFALRNFTQHGNAEDCGSVKRFRALIAAERAINDSLGHTDSAEVAA